MIRRSAMKDVMIECNKINIEDVDKLDLEIFSNLLQVSYFPEYYNSFYKNNELIGYIMSYKYDLQKQFKNVVNICSFAVKENYRCNGLGSKLFQTYLDSLDSGTVVLLEVLITNINAINFYKKRGFKILNLLDENHFRMSKII